MMAKPQTFSNLSRMVIYIEDVFVAAIVIDVNNCCCCCLLVQAVRLVLLLLLRCRHANWHSVVKTIHLIT